LKREKEEKYELMRGANQKQEKKEQEKNRKLKRNKFKCSNRSLFLRADHERRKIPPPPRKKCSSHPVDDFSL
jgi:hypothetical protein